MDTNQMVSRLVSKGANPAEAAKLLNELMTIHEGNNLIVALRYFNFITAGQAEKLAVA
jgi:hypothetical protein